MLKTKTGVTALVVQTVDIEVGRDDGPAEQRRFLLGFGLVSHRVLDTGKVAFRIRYAAATLYDEKAALLDGLEDEITNLPMLVGHDLASTIAAIQATANPPRHLSISALTRFTATAGELATSPEASGSPLSVACAEAGIRCIPEDVGRDRRDFVDDRIDRINERMTLRAAATWKLWAYREASLGTLDRRLVNAGPILDAAIADAFS